MDVYLLAIPHRGDTYLTSAALAVADALRARGADVSADVAPLDRAATAEARRRYRRRWLQQPPDAIHAIGYEAARVALAASPGVPVVVSFDADHTVCGREMDVARRADALLVASSGERRAWIAAGIPAARVHTWYLPVQVADDEAVTPADGRVVVTDSEPDELDVVVRAAEAWDDTSLVHVGDGEDDDAIARASVAVVTRVGRRGGLAVRAARHGVPSVVLDCGASTDEVVDGASGLVLRDDADEREVARAVRLLLRNRLLCRGFGMAALLRVKAVRNPGMAADRALAAYSATLRQRADHLAGQPGIGGTDLPESRERLTFEHLDLAAQLARRYDGRGQSLEDLVQVANLGLVQAARRYDPERGSSFSAFAVPTILGELKRYFRDQAWSVRVSRPVQEAALEVDAVARDVESRDGCPPTAEAVAHAARMSRADVRTAQRARAEALSHASLNRRVDDDEGGHELGDAIGVPDEGLETVEARAAVRQAMESLSEREREVIALRFFGDHTQTEIAERLGVSQVQVSRLLRRTLDTLRNELTAEPG